MAHKKAAAATASQKGNRHGKHRGVKVGDGQFVTCGTILVRQLGTVYLSGDNTNLGRDFSIYAIKDGQVRFSHATKTKKVVSIV